MKRPQILVVLLAVVVIAAGAFFLFRGKGAKPAAKPVASARPDDASKLGAGAGSGRDTANAGQGAPRDVLIDDDPIGALVLEGQVIDAAKDGVGGATVVIGSNPPRTVTTEADGSFSFDKLVGRTYQIVARAPQGVAGPIAARLTATSDPVILTLAAAASLVVEVVDDKGAAIDAATVELRDLDVQSAKTEGGKARITPVVQGGYQLAAWAPGFARAFQWVRVDGPDTAVRIALRKGASVSGRVVTEDGTPVAGARVLYSGASEWSVQPDERLDGKLTDADGKFVFDAVAAGSMRFDARHPDYAPGSSKIVTLDGSTPVEDVEVVLPRGAMIAGVVVDGGGAPVASARVRVGVAGAGFASAGPRQVFSDDQGAWTVKGLPRRELEAVALSDAGSSATVPVDASAGDVAGVKLVVDQTGEIAGIVVDSAGEPIEGIQVQAGPDFRQGGGGDMSQWRLRGPSQELTDAGGQFRLTGLAPGSYRIRATRGQGGRQFGPSPDAVTAKTGDTNVKIVVKTPGGVTGKVAFADGTAPPAFTVSVAFDQRPFATKDGSFTIDDLVPSDDELDVQIKGTGFAPRTIKTKVKEGEIADLGTITVQKGRTIRGTVVAAGAPVEGATVYLGTQIFGTGTSNTAEFGGPPGGRDTKTAVTDETGSFEISGFAARRDLTLVAEHEDKGRSRAVRLVAGDPAEQALVITLEPFGSLSGVVTQGGQIVEGNIVNVQSTTAPGAMYGVASGADGAFRLDRLAPDTYKVSAMTGMNPMRGMGFFSKTVTVTSGQEVKIDVSIDEGPITLSATPTAAGDPQISGMAWIASGEVTASTAKELSIKLANQGVGFSNFTIAMPGQPAMFRKIRGGDYTVCVLPLPTEITARGMQAMGYARDHGDELPAFCKPVTVTATPNDQSMTIAVEPPPVLPDE